MKIYNRLKTFQKRSNATVTMGVFDGVHLGHQQLIQQLHAHARAVGGEVVMVTFWPHPKQVLASPHTTPIQLLTTLDEKVAMLSQLGIGHLLAIRFTKSFSQLSSEAFVREILVAQVGMSQLIVGHDHRFGRKRAGDIALLQAMGLQHNFTVKEVAPTSIDGVVIGSTKIRQLLLEGNVEKAHAYLGRPYEINCAILQQNPNGKQGFNLHLVPISADKLIPADGLYGVQIRLQDGAVEEGMLRIVRKSTALNMVLSIRKYANTTEEHTDLYIRFRSRHKKP